MPSFEFDNRANKDPYTFSNDPVKNDKFKDLLVSISESKANTKLGFYDINLELDSKYRDRSDINTYNSDFKFKVSGRKDVSSGTRTGILGTVEPINNLVQIDISDFLIPNILPDTSTVNRIYMRIEELIGNEITTKTTTNIASNTSYHFTFDINPVVNAPEDNNSRDLLVTNKYIRLTPVIKSLIFKSPTTEILDQLTVSFYMNDEKIIFPTDEFKCILKIGPNMKNELIFPSDHNLNTGDIFEINEIGKSDDYVFNLKNNSEFHVFTSNTEYNTLYPNYITQLNIYEPLTYMNSITFAPSYLSYKNLLSKSFTVDYVRDSKTINFLIDGNYYLLPMLNNNQSHNYLLLSIRDAVDNYDMYVSKLNTSIDSKAAISSQITNNNNLISIADDDLRSSLERLFSLKSFNSSDYVLSYDITVSNNLTMLSGDHIFYIGNRYILNNTSVSNTEKTDLTVKKSVISNETKIIINDASQVDYRLIQGTTYHIDMTDKTLHNSAFVIIPSDTEGVIDRLINITTTVPGVNTPGVLSSFTYPISFYTNHNSKNTGITDFTHTSQYLRQFSSKDIYTGGVITGTTSNEYNIFSITVPDISFRDTIYTMPYEKYRGYNFDYEITADTSDTSQNRSAYVDIGVMNSTPLVFNIDGSNNPIITSTHTTFDGLPLYNNTPTYDTISINNTTYQYLRPLPSSSTKPYMALKWSYVYTLDFSQLSGIKYVVLEFVNDEWGITPPVSSVNTKTFGYNATVPTSEDLPDTSHIQFDANGTVYTFKIDITIHDILYIDLQELIEKTATNPLTTPTTYDKKYLFGKTFKMYYETTGGVKYNDNYSVIKLGSLLNDKSYYLNYFVENYNEAYIDSGTMNKMTFDRYNTTHSLYYEPSSRTNRIRKYKIFKSSVDEELFVYELSSSGGIVYDKYTLSDIFINSGDTILLDVNHYSLNNKSFNLELITNTSIDLTHSESFNPKLNSSNVGTITTNSDNLDITSSLYNYDPDTLGLSDEYTIVDDKSIVMSLTLPIDTDYILNYNGNNGPDFNLSFGRRYRIDFTTLTGFNTGTRSDFSIIAVLEDEIYNINYQPITHEGINSIVGITYDGVDTVYSNFINGSIINRPTDNIIMLDLEDGKEQYLQIDLRHQLFNIDYSSLKIAIYIYNRTTDTAFDSIVSTFNLMNYQFTIDLKNIKDELTKTLEYHDNYKPSIKFYLNDSTIKNDTLKFVKTSNRKEMYHSNEDNYNDFIFSGIIDNNPVSVKNIYKLHINYDLSVSWNKNNSVFKLQKMTGNDRDRINNFNDYRIDIDLFYSFEYHIDMTDYASDLYQYFNTAYNDILSSNEAVLSLYLDPNLNVKYLDATKVIYDSSTDKYNRFSGGVPTELPVIAYKLSITEVMPNVLYYGTVFTDSTTGNRVIIRGGRINIHAVNVSTQLIHYSPDNQSYSLKPSEKTYYLYTNNLHYDNMDALYKLSEYQNAIELFFKIPKINEYDFYLRKNTTYRDSVHSLTYNELQDRIEELNNKLYNNNKGISNSTIEVVYTGGGITFTSNNVNYVNTFIYLISDYSYKFNLNNVNNFSIADVYTGNFIIETNKRLIDLTEYITPGANSSYVLTKNQFKISGGNSTFGNPSINSFNLVINNNISSSGDYLTCYFENHPEYRYNIYLDGDINGNLTARTVEQEELIQKIKDNKTTTSDLFNIYESHMLLESIKNTIIKMETYTYDMKSKEIQKLYDDLEIEKTKNAANIIKSMNLVLRGAYLLTSLESNSGTLNKYLILQRLNSGYYSDNNNIPIIGCYMYSTGIHTDLGTDNLTIYTDSIYGFTFKSSDSDLLQPGNGTFISTPGELLKLYTIDMNGTYTELSVGVTDLGIYVNEVGISPVINSITVFISSSYENISNLYFGTDSMKYRLTVKNSKTVSSYPVYNNNNTILLEETNTTGVKYYSSIKLNGDEYNTDTFINALQRKLNDGSRLNYKYSLSLNDDNTKLSIMSNSNNNTVVIPITVPYNPLSGNNALVMGYTYVFEYSSSTFDLYTDSLLTIRYDMNVSKMGNKLYVYITDKTPKILYYGDNTNNSILFIQNYDNIINVQHDTTSFLLQFHYTVSSGNIVPYYKTSDMLVNITDTDIPGYYSGANFSLVFGKTYVFDYSQSNVTFNLYTDPGLTTVHTSGVVNNTTSKTLKIKVDTLFDLYYDGGRIEVDNTISVNNSGFRIRFDMETIYDDVYANNNVNFYNSFVEDNTYTAAVIVKRPKQIYFGDTTSNFILNSYSDGTDLHVMTQQYNNSTKGYDIVSGSDTIITNTLSGNTKVVYITQLNRSYYQKNNNITTYSRFLISYDDDTSSYYSIVEVQNDGSVSVLNVNGAAPLTIWSSTTARVYNDDSVNGLEPIPINDPTSALSTNSDHQRYVFVVLCNMDGTMDMLYYDEVNSLLVLSITGFNLNSTISNFVGGDSGAQATLATLTYSSISSSTQLNDVDVLVNVRYLTINGYYSTFIIPFSLTRTNYSSTTWFISINSCNNIHQYSSINNNAPLLTYTSNTFLWSGNSTSSNVIYIITYNGSSFETKHSISNSTYDAVLYGNIIDDKALLINSSANNISVNILNLIDYSYTSNININDRNNIVDALGNVIDVSDKKSSNVIYNVIHGYDNSLNRYQYPISSFIFNDYNIYSFYVYHSNETNRYNSLSYVFIDGILTDIPDNTFTLNKTYLGVSKYRDTPSTNSPSNIFSSGNIYGVNISNTNNSTEVVKLKYDINNTVADYDYHKHLSSTIVELQTLLTNLKGEASTINVSLNNMLTVSDGNINNYLNKQTSIPEVDTYDTQLQNAERTYKDLVTDLVLSTNTLSSYKTAVDSLLTNIRKSNVVYDNNNLSYYANMYLNTNGEVTLLNTLITEKNNAIETYHTEIDTFNLSYYENLSKISEYQTQIEIKNTVITDSLNTAVNNIYNEFKLSGLNTKLIDPIYLQNIIMKERLVYLNQRRFKIPLTLRILVKDSFTNYLTL